MSYNEIADGLGMSSIATVKKFCGYLAEPYLFFYLPRFDNKRKLMKKAVDNGFVFARSFELSSNKGRQLENMVFVELVRRGYKVGNTLLHGVQ